MHEYKNVQRWTINMIAKRPGVQRGRMVNRTWGEPASQLHERHEASDFETKTQDKLGEAVQLAPCLRRTLATDNNSREVADDGSDQTHHTDHGRSGDGDWPLHRGPSRSRPRQGGAAMSFFFLKKAPYAFITRRPVPGYPLLLIAGGGLNSTISGLSGSYPPFDSFVEFKAQYRCIAADLRNANAGQSSGPLEIEQPQGSRTDDHLGLMDHLGIDKFMVMGFCIGGPLIWNLLRRALIASSPHGAGAAERLAPGDARPVLDNNIKGWAPELVKRRPEITMETAEKSS